MYFTLRETRFRVVYSIPYLFTDRFPWNSRRGWLRFGGAAQTVFMHRPILVPGKLILHSLQPFVTRHDEHPVYRTLTTADSEPSWFRIIERAILHRPILFLPRISQPYSSPTAIDNCAGGLVHVQHRRGSSKVDFSLQH